MLNGIKQFLQQHAIVDDTQVIQGEYSKQDTQTSFYLSLWQLLFNCNHQGLDMKQIA